MKRWLRKHVFGTGKKSGGEIYPDEIFLDSSNLPAFDRSQFEGRIEKPISKKTFQFLGAALLCVGFLFLARVWTLQVADGASYAQLSENNRLRRTIIFPERGIIFDRNNVELAWNEPNPNEPFPLRRYGVFRGVAHVIGYVKKPARDASGNYYHEDFVGETGAEEAYNNELSGNNGTKILEANARGQVISESVLEPPRDGTNVTLSIDAGISGEFYDGMKELAERVGFSGGAAVMLDVQTGELLALVSYPEYDSNILSEGTNRGAIQKYLTNSQNPFLNRATMGLYAPGSTVKPYFAIGALDARIITPEKKILSTGSISIPNPFIPGAKSVFKDWRAHGWVDMRRALAVSSDVYFYEIGGGYLDQKGLGIDAIDKYARLFGFGSETGLFGFSEQAGVIPTPAWKEENFTDGAWRIGNTYHTAIGQYGFQVTPLQEARAVASLANDGVLPVPSLQKGGAGEKGISLPFSPNNIAVAREGMRLGVTEGILQALNVPYVEVAAKSGTAEIGTATKNYVNSWIIGFFPYEAPRYAFAIVMERGPVANTTGALSVMRRVLDWMQVHRTEYFSARTEGGIAPALN